MDEKTLDNKAAAPLSTASVAHAEAAEPKAEPKTKKFACGHHDDGNGRSRHRQVDGLPVDEIVCQKCADKDYSGDSLHGA